MNVKQFSLSAALAAYLGVCGHSAHALEVSQTPLFLGVDVPGNLVFVPSVEWPTINSVANLRENYTPNQEFVGYFNSDVCYEYRYSSNRSDRHFFPVEWAVARQCFGDGHWSGNFLNWAATQTIDPFRKTLTGGYRVRDEVGVTWLEKARHDGQGGSSIYPRREINDPLVLKGATPFDTAISMRMRIDGLGERMRFRLNGDDVNNNVVWFNPDIHPPADLEELDKYAFDVSIRVAVCVGEFREDNCKRYGTDWKPEGLIQANADRLRYSVFGYLNDDNVRRDGAALRARQKFVGPKLPGGADNPAFEWNPATGTLRRNPDDTDATDTSAQFGLTIQDSGVINYLNKFGQMTSKDHKSFDPVSELFYAAVRYIRGEDNVDAYSNGANFEQADGFPVITNWGKNGHDPVLASCQVNVALGIGDIYTHRDKNLPGPTATADEPPKPAEVLDDDWIDVVEVTNRVGDMEGINNLGSSGNSWTGRNNSAYIAGLAYWANTTDMRPGGSGKTTMSTYWVDVLEAQSLETIPYNQYILATKYGGADVPSDFDPMNDDIQTEWWHTNGDTISPFGPRGRGEVMPRPDNYFLAGNAADMVSALSDAFQVILSETANNITSLSTTSTRLDTDTLAIQAGFDSEFWTGELLGIDPISGDVEWRVSDDLASASCMTRNIVSWNPDAATAASARVDFDENMPQTMQDRIEDGGSGQTASQLINYICGSRTGEGGALRTRGDTVLGDIVNSRPALAGQTNEGWSRLGGNVGASYDAYVDGAKASRPEVVYVGANDGMLHGFDAENGNELMAYVPGALLGNLGELADVNYTHRFFVDGQLAVGDAYNNGWKTVLVGGLGAGGKAMYAIDVTDPDSPKVLWEFTDIEDPDLGYSFGDPAITRIGDDWVAVFGNGYGSENEQAFLYVLDLFDGTVRYKIQLGPAGGNGLSGVATLPNPETGTETIRAYAGDLGGTVWRVDFDPDSGSPSVPFSQGLFQDPNGRPITATPALAASPGGGIQVFVGTGKLIETADRIDSGMAPETFWSLIDKNSRINNTSGIEEVSTTVAGDSLVIEGDVGEDGWSLDLTLGASNRERVLTRARVIFGQVVFTTFEPDPDECSAGGAQRVYVLDAVSGTGRLDNICNNCGVVEVGTGAPINPPVVIKPAVNPDIDSGDPGGNSPEGEERELPDGSTVGAITGWCSAFGVQTPASGFLELGNICDGRQVWRQSQ